MWRFARWQPHQPRRRGGGPIRNDGSSLSYGANDLKDARKPLIAHWGMNHFVVIEEVNNKHAFINDPATGPRRVRLEELDQSFTGVAILLEPGEAFQPAGEPPRALSGIAARLRGNFAAFAFIVLSSVLLVMPALLVAAFSQVFVDDILIGRSDDWLIPLLWIMAATALAMSLLTWLQLDALLRLETRLSVVESATFLEHLMQLPVAFFGQRHPGDIGGRVILNDRVARLVSGDVGRGLLGLVTIAVYVAAMLFYDVVLTIIVVVAAALNLGALAILSRSLQDDNQRLMSRSMRVDGLARQGLQMIETYRSSGTEHLLLAQMAGQRAAIANITQRLGLRRALLDGMPAFIGIAAGAMLLAVGGARIMAGEMTIGQLVAFQALTIGFMAPVAQLMGVATQMQDARANMMLLEDTLNQAPAPEFLNAQARTMSARFSGRVELRNVTFGHSRLETPLLADVSLTIEPGQRLGIVGGSGSGKSTLALLIAGLYSPWSGEVLLDGRRVDSLPRDILRREVAVVDQQGFLFDGTVRDNLSMWDATLADERLVDSARTAGIHGDILARRGGYATTVAEEGRNWSGGQRSRLELARALVNDPSVLILDEATAALDNRTEAVLMHGLRRRGCTMLIVAHRLALVRDCDIVIVMDKGRIVQCGTPDDLQTEPGLFRTMLAAG